MHPLQQGRAAARCTAPKRPLAITAVPNAYRNKLGGLFMGFIYEISALMARGSFGASPRAHMYKHPYVNTPRSTPQFDPFLVWTCLMDKYGLVAVDARSLDDAKWCK